MPQFDFTTFQPQIFWLLICFGILYYAASRIILPRISSILSHREEKIDSNKISAATIQKKIDEIQQLSKDLRDQSTTSYSKAIEDTLKECVINREKSLNKVRDDIEKMTKNSEEKVANFINESKSDYDIAAKSVADAIVKKIFGQALEFKGNIKVPINKFDN